MAGDIDPQLLSRTTVYSAIQRVQLGRGRGSLYAAEGEFGTVEDGRRATQPDHPHGYVLYSDTEHDPELREFWPVGSAMCRHAGGCWPDVPCWTPFVHNGRVGHEELHAYRTVYVAVPHGRVQ